MSTGLLGDTRTANVADPGTVAFAVRGFLYDREIGCTPRTVEYYREKLVPFSTWLTAEGVQLARAITLAHYREYLEHCRKRGNTPGGLHCHARAIRAFLRWCVDEFDLDPKVVVKLRMPKVPEVVVHPFTLDNLDGLLDAALQGRMPERDTAILYTLIDTGMRAGELCGLKDEDVNGERILVRGKGWKERWLPISARTRRAIWKWQAKRGSAATLFTTRTGDPLTTKALYQAFRRHGGLAQLEGVRCSPHTVRHSVATEWLNDGGQLFDLQKLLGHSSPTISLRYAKQCDKGVAETHRRVSLAEKVGRRRK